MKTTIIDDSVSKETQNKIIDLVTSTKFNWFYFDTTLSNPLGLGDFVDVPFMFHMVVENFQTTSTFREDLKEIENKFLEILGNEYITYKVRVNLVFPHSNNINSNSPPHQDMDLEGAVGIYYIDDCDGNTILYASNKLDVTQEIEAKKGRMALFDGNVLHSSGVPYTNKKRLVINFNFIKVPK